MAKRFLPRRVNKRDFSKHAARTAPASKLGKRLMRGGTRI